ncbi:unnamed protein product [Paramecium octaurelia]|uniref:Uncharacterized protein n=1 Tax=Paramecium octaurelia TaxID=43137 RepID=A0A8S1WTE0_PAROT|nr:unnamed protein product [Paramecium octaurelia]
MWISQIQINRQLFSHQKWPIKTKTQQYLLFTSTLLGSIIYKRLSFFHPSPLAIRILLKQTSTLFQFKHYPVLLQQSHPFGHLYTDKMKSEIPHEAESYSEIIVIIALLPL